jgi:hypothetical protein
VEAFLTQQTLLAEFLTHLKRIKDDQLMQLKRETSVIQADLDRVNKVIQVKQISYCPTLPSYIFSVISYKVGIKNFACIRNA